MGSKILSMIGQQIVYGDFSGCDGWQTGSTKIPPDSPDLRFRIGYSVQTVQFGFLVHWRPILGFLNAMYP